MAVYKDKKQGTWYCSITYLDAFGNKKTTKKRGFELKKQALEYEHAFKRAEIAQNEQARFSDVFTSLIEYRSTGIRETTKKEYSRVYELYLSDFDKLYLSKITTKKVIDKANQIKQLKKSVAYRNFILVLFKSILSHANTIYDTKFKTKLIKSVPKTSHDITENVTWNDNEFELFLSHVENKVYKAFFQFLYKTGCRRGEAIALTWNDIKEDKATFNKSMRILKDGAHPTKTLSSLRSIKIDPKTLEMLHDIKNGPYVFGGEFPLSPNAISYHFNNGIKKSGVPRIRLHDLRHSHATNLINKGANIVAVSKRLGHSSTNMTLKVYTHLLEETEQQLIDLL